MTRTVTHVKDLNDRQAVYRIDPSVEFGYPIKRKSRFVLISDALSCAETFVFPCTSKGEVKNWLELPYSISGEYNRKQVIENLITMT